MSTSMYVAIIVAGIVLLLLLCYFGMRWYRRSCAPMAYTPKSRLQEVKLELDPAMDFATVQRWGNVGSVSLPASLSLAVEQGFVQPGHRVCLQGIGSVEPAARKACGRLRPGSALHVRVHRKRSSSGPNCAHSGQQPLRSNSGTTSPEQLVHE